MGTYILVIPSAAHAGRDDEYNEWYDTIHLQDICAIPGVTSGKRFDAMPSSPMPPPAPYLAIYEIETEDPTTVLAEIGNRARSGQLRLCSALDVSTAPMWLYRKH